MSHLIQQKPIPGFPGQHIFLVTEPIREEESPDAAMCWEICKTYGVAVEPYEDGYMAGTKRVKGALATAVGYTEEHAVWLLAIQNGWLEQIRKRRENERF